MSESPDTQAEAALHCNKGSLHGYADCNCTPTLSAEPDGEACLCGGDGVRYTVGADADCPMHGFPRCKPHGQRQCATCAAPAQDGAEVEALACDHSAHVRGCQSCDEDAERFIAYRLGDDWLAAFYKRAHEAGQAQGWHQAQTEEDPARDAVVAAKVAEQIAQGIEAKYLGADCGRQYDGRESPDAALQNAYDEGLETAARIARAAAPAGER